MGITLLWLTICGLIAAVVYLVRVINTLLQRIETLEKLAVTDAAIINGDVVLERKLVRTLEIKKNWGRDG